MELDTIYNEDCLATLDKIPNDYLPLMVTSPPYDGLREHEGFKFEYQLVADTIPEKPCPAP